MDKSVDTPFENGEWLVPIYKGREVRVGDMETREQAWRRKRTIHDTVDNAAAQELQKKNEAMMEAWEEKAAHDATQYAMGSSAEMVDIPEGLQRNPQIFIAKDNDMEEEVKREVLLKMQRDAKILEQEERDKHEAEQCLRIKKQQSATNAGRPNKIKSELLSDAVKLVRDKAQKVEDNSHEFQWQLQDITKEISHFFSVVPQDFAKVQASCKTDMDEICEKMKKCKDLVFGMGHVL